jgi:hypothetical protein
MSLRLWNWLSEHLLEIVTFQRMLTIVTDEIVKAIEQLWFNEAVLGLAVVLFGSDATMVNSSLVSATQCTTINRHSAQQ